MREMKQSGIPWLGNYPSNWNLKKIKYCLQERIEKNNPMKTTDILSLTAKQGVIPYNQKEGGGNKPKEDVSAYRLAYPGDIVMNSMNILSGSVGLSQYFGCVSPVYYMLRPWSIEEDVRYYNYIFQTTAFQRSLYGLGNGILIKESGNGKLNTIRMRIPMDKFGNLFVPVCSPEEQKKRADFLDKKCLEIDALTTDIQQQIETLEQYKRSVISETVTKGINSDVEMKDSGIEWIGEIPVSWQVIRIKYLLNERNTRSMYGEEEPLSMSQKYGLIPTSEMDNVPHMAATNVGAKLAFIDDLVFNKLKAHLGVFSVSRYEGLVSPDYSVYYSKGKCNIKFLEYLFKTDLYINEFRKKITGVGAGLSRLYTSGLFDIHAICPPLEEQRKISEYLTGKVEEINAIIASKQQQLEILSEYRKSLIYEYVTGKKEVPANES